MAGGTGGHVFPALACAKQLISQGHQVEWLGTQRGLESRLIPAANIPIHYLNITGLRGKNKLSLLLAPIKLIHSLLQAIGIIRGFKPDVVLGMGGFVTGSGGLASRLLGIPLVIHEQNAIAGLTNRLLAPLAQRVLTAFPCQIGQKESNNPLGNPLRQDIINLQTEKKTTMPLKVLVFGGSLGAQIFNQTLPQVYPQLRDKILLWHQTGEKQYSQTKTAFKDYPEVKVTAFIDDMATAYQWADLVICRAGALTVSELAQVGLPSILVPYPFAVDDHQTANAQFLVNAKAAWLCPQNDFNRDRLFQLLNNIQPQQLETMAKAAKICAKPNAVQTVVNICLQTAK